MILRKSISTQVTFGATAVLAAVGLAVVYTVYTPHQETLARNAFRGLESVAQQERNRIFDSIARLREDVQFLSQTPPLSGISRAREAGGVDPLDGDTEQVWRSRLQTIFMSFIRRRPDYAQIRLIDYDTGGVEIVRVDRAGPNMLVAVGQAGLQRKGDADYTKAARLLDLDAVYLSDINLNREFGRVTLPWTPTIRAATPVFGEDGEPFGVVVINYNLTGLFEGVMRSRPEDSELTLTNSKGDYLIDSSGRPTFGFDFGRPHRLQEELPEAEPFLGAGSPEEAVFLEYERPSNDVYKKYVTHLSKISFDPANPERTLTLGLESSYDSLMAESYLIGRQSAIEAAALILGGSLIVFLLMRRAIGPLSLIAESTDRVASGEYSVELPPESEDEVGRLSSAFGRMVEQIKERTNKIQSQQASLEATNARLEAARIEVEAKAVELEQASQYKSEFLARMAHDLRTPLNSMLILANGFAMNREGNLTAEQEDAAKILAGAGVDLLDLINDLLDLSKVEAGKLEIVAKPTDISELLERVRDQFLPLAENKYITLTVDADPQLPDTIITDPRRLRQVLWNLMSNALKFTATGSVTLSTQRSADGRQVIFEVADTGAGIPEDQLERIFSPYRRLERDVRSASGGTGLGLAIVKELTEALGGELTVQSQVGEGSRFEVRLPLLTTADGTIAPRVPAQSVGLQSAEARRILIADDNASTRWAVARTLKTAYPHAVIDEAESAAQAIREIRQCEYSCVILDYHLPQMTGLEVLRELVADPPHLMPRVLLYTGRQLTSDEEKEAARLSAVVVAKDGTLNRLIEAIGENRGGGGKSLEGRLLLLVEDDSASLYALSRELVYLGAGVETARNGQEAIDTLGDRKDIDAVVMDMRMPVMDGYAAIRLIRRNKLHANLPIVSLTADVAPGDREQCVAAGASTFVSKPVDSNALADFLVGATS